MAITKEELQEIIKATVKTVMGDELALIKTENQSSIQTLFATQNDAKSKRAANDPSLAIGSVVRCLAVAKGNAGYAAELAEKHYGKDSDVSKSLVSNDASAGGTLIGEDMSAEVIELLRPLATVRGSNPVVIPMPKGNITLPKITGGATASYAGESQNGPTSELNTGQLKLTFRKLITLVPISNDLLRFDSYGADAIVRDDLISGMAQREDLAFLRGDGTEDTPKGFLSWAPTANKFNANATVNLDNVTSDLATAVLNLENANVRMIRPVWFMSPRSKMYLMKVRDGNGNYAFRDEMLRGTLWGFPFKSTTQIPSNLGGGTDESEVYLVDMADAVIGESTQIAIDASGDAAYHDGNNIQASFSRDETVIRAIAEHDFGMRHDASVTVIQAVKWV